MVESPESRVESSPGGPRVYDPQKGGNHPTCCEPSTAERAARWINFPLSSWERDGVRENARQTTEAKEPRSAEYSPASGSRPSSLDPRPQPLAFSLQPSAFLEWVRLWTLNVAVVLFFLVAFNSQASIHKDEAIVFFPSLAHRSTGEDSWECLVHGMIFERETRRAPVSVLRRTLGLNGVTLTPEETRLFNERTRSFLVDHERRKEIKIRLGEQVFTVGKSGANGHFSGKIKLAASWAARLAVEPVRFQAVLLDGDTRDFSGTILFVAEQGISIISDVDDTIKISQVREPKQLLANTFYRPFKPVPGMADLYRLWSATNSVSVHYVSASPWQLFEPIHDFARTNGFPAGTFHLKQFRATDKTFLSLFTAPEKYKLDVIQPLLKQFPKRHFILVGDSGEKDPEIYGTLARRYPELIQAIYIRDVTGDLADSPRYRDAFKGVPPSLWRIFKEPNELR
jgi:hypothetical protein